MDIPVSQKFNGYRQVEENCETETDTEDETSSSGSDISFGKVYRNPVPVFKPVKTKGELDVEDLPPVEELTISVDEKELVKIGQIHATVTKQVVIKAEKGQKPLDVDSVLFLSGDKPLGRIFEVFGPIKEPFYVVLFDSPDIIKDKNITVGDSVYFAPEKEEITSYVFVDLLTQQKGSDASWKDNNEPPDEHLDYSDDEQEKAAKLKRKKDCLDNRSGKESTDNEVVYIPPPKPSPSSYNNTSKSSSTYLNNPISESRFYGRNLNSNYSATRQPAYTQRACGLLLRPFQPFVPLMRNGVAQDQGNHLRLNPTQSIPMNMPPPRPVFSPQPPMFNTPHSNNAFGGQYQFIPPSQESRFMVLNTTRASPVRPMSPYYTNSGFSPMPIFGTQPQQNLANCYGNGSSSSSAGYTSPPPMSVNSSNARLRPFEVTGSNLVYGGGVDLHSSQRTHGYSPNIVQPSNANLDLNRSAPNRNYQQRNPYSFGMPNSR